MKKFSCFIVAMLSLLLLASCGKSEAAKNADAQIVAIGDVTQDSDDAITAAEAAVAALTDDERAELENLQILEEARDEYGQVLLKAEAAEVDESIAAIGGASLESADEIYAARARYDSTSPDVQALVANLPALERLESELCELQAEEVIELIDGIGEVTLESEDAVSAAREAYGGLRPEAAALVTNLSVLEAAERRCRELKAERAEQALSNLVKVEDRVSATTHYLPSQMPHTGQGFDSWQRSFFLPYISIKGDSIALRLLCNYTGNNWVFFDTIDILVDGEQRSGSFDYFDISRDASGGKVREYISLDAGNDADISLLWDISDSSETIIRFHGDDYRYDLTVSAADKQGIADVLTAYEAFIDSV